ncbi:hypothetical protein [Amnibacterium setariae]|uniref:Uncharacterized protein n=1 Tax=Amnibacterium setariae TaxID=2306585 RepID=A0A3A1TZ94_9MICO|nr:hypothetical protein [Amnibacterium setariae]RIX30035.1 hypothetical protein D1781_00740 [Amnibacterium setariae]
MNRDTLAAREPLLLGAPAPVLAGGGAALALVLAAAAALLGRRELAAPGLEIVALVVLAVAGVAAVLLASPFRAPFTAGAHAAVLGLVLLAVVLDAAAQDGRNAVVADDWGPMVLPVFLLVLATLRPPREVLLGGVLAAAASSAAVAALSPEPLRGVAAVLTGVLPPAIAATALGATTLRALRRGGARAVTRSDAASVQEEAVARLEAEAIPLLAAVEDAGTITAAQAERARAIAAGLRAALVADLARGWLADAGFRVDDPDGYAERMTAAQRTALRTTVASLPLADFERPGLASVRGQDRDAVLELALPVAARPRRTRVAPLVPLLRSAFARADVRIGDEQVSVRVELTVPR